MQDVEQSIRERAYHLWLESGCQNGNANAHWLQAQREVLDTSLSQLGPVTKSKTAKPKRALAPRKKRAA